MYSLCHHDKFSVILVSGSLLGHTSRLWRLFISDNLTALLRSRLNIGKVYSGGCYSRSYPSVSRLFHPNSECVSNVNKPVYCLNIWPSGWTLATAAETQIALVVRVQSAILAMTAKPTIALFARHLCTDLRIMALNCRNYFSVSLYNFDALKQPIQIPYYNV